MTLMVAWCWCYRIRKKSSQGLILCFKSTLMFYNDKIIYRRIIKWKNTKSIAAVIVAIVIITMTSCSSQDIIEYNCEFCGQTFTSVGSVSALYDGSETALCDDCINRARMYLAEEYCKGLYWRIAVYEKKALKLRFIWEII